MTITNNHTKAVQVSRSINLIGYLFFLIIFGMCSLTPFSIFLFFVAALGFFKIENQLVYDTHNNKA